MVSLCQYFLHFSLQETLYSKHSLRFFYFDMSKFARRSKNCEKLETSQNFVRLSRENNCYVEVNDAVFKMQYKKLRHSFSVSISQLVNNNKKEIDQLTNTSR